MKKEEILKLTELLESAGYQVTQIGVDRYQNENSKKISIGLFIARDKQEQE